MTTNSQRARRLLPFAVALTVSVACSGPTGGPTPGPADTHCQGQSPQATSQAACHPDAGVSTGDADGGTADIDAGDTSGGSTSDYGATLYGTAGDDDDCKYHVKWTSTPIRENDNVTFTVTATRKTDGSPLLGAYPFAEVFLNPTHPSPSVPNFTDKGGGVYDVGPVVFDKAGQWTVRFHFYEQCADTQPDSPHGHAAFFVTVP